VFTPKLPPTTSLKKLSEIISNTGHNVAADYWSLGILVFELLSKRTPFRAKDDLAIYEGILRGIHR
jgi:serine/threonine protein kinase